MEKQFTLKRYKSIDDIVLALYQADDPNFSFDDLKEGTVVAVDENNNLHDLSYDQQKEGIEIQGHWGWIDENNTIHYWVGKELDMKELVHFFAHEIAHKTGNSNPDDYLEELRVEKYADVATLAYEFAVLFKNEN